MIEQVLLLDHCGLKRQYCLMFLQFSDEKPVFVIVAALRSCFFVCPDSSVGRLTECQDHVLSDPEFR